MIEPRSNPINPSKKPPPIQARAAAKRDTILNATETLLSQYRPSDLTTRMIADKAAIPIGSVYRYFENIEDLLLSLFERMNAGTVQTLKDHIQDNDADWKSHLDQIFGHLQSMHNAHPTYGALLSHCKTNSRQNDEISGLLTTLLKQRAPAITSQRLDMITLTVMAMIDGVERRLYQLDDADRSPLLEQTRIAVAAYLSTHIEGPF